MALRAVHNQSADTLDLNLGTACVIVTTGTEGSTLCYLLTDTRTLRLSARYSTTTTDRVVRVGAFRNRSTLAGTVVCIEQGKSWCDKEWNRCGDYSYCGYCSCCYYYVSQHSEY